MQSIKRFGAHYIFPGHIPPVSGGILETDEDGTIIGIVKHKDSMKELARMEFFNGILCPEFVFMPKPPFFYFPQLKKYEDFLSNGNDQNGEKSGENIFNWIKNIQLRQDSPDLEELINLFTIQSSIIAGKQERLGSFVPGKIPGIIFIDKINYKYLRLTSGSTMKKLI